MAADLVDLLLDQTGLHLGMSTDTRDGAAPQVARVVVTALPGRSGVTFDYEGLNLVTNQEQRFGHAEHSVLARTARGLALYAAHIHSPVLTELRESEPGTFEAVEGSSPFPVAIRIEVPSSGRILYTWSFGEPGGDFDVRITGDVTLVRNGRQTP